MDDEALARELQLRLKGPRGFALARLAATLSSEGWSAPAPRGEGRTPEVEGYRILGVLARAARSRRLRGHAV